MANLKKQTVGFWLAVCTLILGIVSLIVYNVNVAGAGYFHGATVETGFRYMVIAIILAACVVVLTLIPVEGMVAKILTVVSDVLRIITPALFIASVLTIVSARVQGFAFIYFSNVEVLQEVQTPANLSSAHGAIANIVLLAVSAIVGIVGAFFSTRKSA
jgi:hypothetical protein